MYSLIQIYLYIFQVPYIQGFTSTSPRYYTYKTLLDILPRESRPDGSLGDFLSSVLSFITCIISLDEFCGLKDSNFIFRLLFCLLPAIPTPPRPLSSLTEIPVMSRSKQVSGFPATAMSFTSLFISFLSYLVNSLHRDEWPTCLRISSPLLLPPHCSLPPSYYPSITRHYLRLNEHLL